MPLTLTSVSPDDVSIYFPSSTRELVHPSLVSVSSKHSHFGRTVPLTLASKLHVPRPAQLAGQNMSGQTLLNLGQIIFLPNTLETVVGMSIS